MYYLVASCLFMLELGPSRFDPLESSLSDDAAAAAAAAAAADTAKVSVFRLPSRLLLI